jgi:hypothetical protein
MCERLLRSVKDVSRGGKSVDGRRCSKLRRLKSRRLSRVLSLKWKAKRRRRRLKVLL